MAVETIPMSDLIAAEFGAKCNLYEVLGVKKDASDKEITKSYHKLALRYHPDKQGRDQRTQEKATKKFQAISAIHAILITKESREYYDATGTYTSNEEDANLSTSWKDYFDKIFPKVTENEIEEFEKKYRSSEEEEKDVLSAYVKHEGRLPKIIDEIMLSTQDDERRFAEMIQRAIERKEVPLFQAWRSFASIGDTEMSNRRKAREKKRKKEAMEAEASLKQIRSKNGGDASSPNSAIRKTKREMEFSSMVSSLEAKYTAKSRKSKALKPSGSKHSEPSEEEFLAAQERLKKRKKDPSA
uniref:Uncharacterized protein AlNc14C26G2594 n=1 Tax=Albugo laibachii Nc14 TaxID=890382 RepID=F0W6V8_9STRA|nr:conserved hypothetical protein [Albugo laibachii Nc14]|eukprot:CCA16853.1 conserved hypothetical protein [Albugo laibachii Nc14]